MWFPSVFSMDERDDVTDLLRMSVGLRDNWETWSLRWGSICRNSIISISSGEWTTIDLYTIDCSRCYLFHEKAFTNIPWINMYTSEWHLNSISSCESNNAGNSFEARKVIKIPCKCPRSSGGRFFGHSRMLTVQRGLLHRPPTSIRRVGWQDVWNQILTAFQLWTLCLPETTSSPNRYVSPFLICLDMFVQTKWYQAF